MVSPAMAYTQALFAAAQALDVAEPSMHDLHAVREVVVSCKGLFYNPSTPVQALHALLQDAFGGKIEPLVWEFISLLACKRLLKWLPEIDQAYQRLANRLLGHIRVRLRMPFAPEEFLLEKLSSFLTEQGMFRGQKRGKVEFDVLVQPDLLGGFIADYDGRVLDASLRTQLQALRAGAGHNR